MHHSSFESLDNRKPRLCFVRFNPSLGALPLPHLERVGDSNFRDRCLEGAPQMSSGVPHLDASLSGVLLRSMCSCPVGVGRGCQQHRLGTSLRIGCWITVITGTGRRQVHGRGVHATSSLSDVGRFNYPFINFFDVDYLALFAVTADPLMTTSWTRFHIAAWRVQLPREDGTVPALSKFPSIRLCPSDPLICLSFDII
jgi:hypothetical protein